MKSELNLEAIAASYYTPLFRFGLSLTRSETEAADLTQQTFLILAQRSYQVRDVSKIKCWLFTTLRRLFLHQVRRQTNHPEVEFKAEYHDQASSETGPVRALDGQTVLQALQQVDPTYRTALELFYLGEMSYKEIAETLDVPIGTVMSRLSRGKDQLKGILAAINTAPRNNIIPLRRDEKMER